jgi:surfeit locus 1 family protein
MSQRRGLPWVLLAAAALCALFLAMGTWQVQRLFWKKDLIARVQQRVQAPPAAAPSPGDWPRITAAPQDFEYRRLQLQGVFRHDDETLVQAATTLGAGFWVLTPLVQADGTTVFVNRGFVPPAQRDPARRGVAAPVGPVTVVGLLRLTEPRGGFLRDNDPAANRWHSRDIAAIAQARGLPPERVAPYFVDAVAPATGAVAGQWPVPGLTVLHFTDNHLVYALTWYALALMVAAGGFFVLRQARRSDSTP